MDELREKFPEKFNESGAMDYKWFEKEIRPNNFVYVRHDVNSISFTLQNGAINENGVNGCQVETIIHAAMVIIKGLNEKFHSPHNDNAIDYLYDAICELEARTAERKARGVEGTSQA
jgi:hypothetical protein